jgi:hypothetical protein
MSVRHQFQSGKRGTGREGEEGICNHIECFSPSGWRTEISSFLKNMQTCFLSVTRGGLIMMAHITYGAGQVEFVQREKKLNYSTSRSLRATSG